MRPVLLLVPVIVLGCSDERRNRPPPEEPTLESIAVSPASAMLEPDEAIELIATGTYSDDTSKDVGNLVAWSSSDEEIATVDEDGFVIGVAPGNVKIEATLGEISGSATVIVARAVDIEALTLQPTTGAIAIGGTIQISAIARFEDMTTMDITGDVDWVSSDDDVATVSGGLVTGVSAGSVSISASDPFSGMIPLEPAVISVAGRAPSTVTVAPPMVQLPIGATQQFTATAHFEDGTTADITSVADWSSSTMTVASIDGAGLATALADGITSITARDPSGVQASVTLRVVPAALTSLTIAPPAAMIGLGDRFSFTASGEFTDGTSRDMTNLVIWSSSDTDVATIDNAPGSQGDIDTVGLGTTVISARDVVSNMTADADLTVTEAVLESIVVLPTQVSIPLGSARQFQAIGLYSDNGSRDLTSQVTWSSSAQNVATIDTAGLASSVGAGTAIISALDPVTGISSDDAGQSADLTVDPPAVVSIAVTPPTRAMLAAGTQQFTATGLFSDGSSRGITQSVTWGSSSPAVAINSAGLATGQSQGSAVIAALDPATDISSNDSNQSANVVVSLTNLVSIAVTPTSTTVPAGADVQFIATGTYAGGATQDLTAVVTWASSNAAVARVSNSAGSRGVATALAAGAATISATEPGSGISSGPQSAAMTVQALALTSVAIAPQNPTIEVDSTLALTAIGTYTGGARFDVTSAVAWSSSNPSFAAVGNVEGSRGVVTGVAAGNVTITALHAASGASGTTSVIVEPGIATVARSWNGPTAQIDSTPNFGVNVGMVAFSAGDFAPGAVITDVDVSINFRKTGGTCAAPTTTNAYHAETNFRIQGGTGTQVVLANPGTWSGGTAISPVTVTFDQSAATAPTGTPVAGTFLPLGGNLDMFDGQSPTGTWILQAGDTVGGDPLCIISYTVTITAQ